MNTNPDNQDFSSILHLKYINDKDIQSIIIDESYTNIRTLQIENCPNLISINISNQYNFKRIEIIRWENRDLITSLTIRNSSVDVLHIFESKSDWNSILDTKVNRFSIISSDFGNLNLGISDNAKENDLGSIFLGDCKFDTISVSKSIFDTISISNLRFNGLEFKAISCQSFKANQIIGQEDFSNFIGRNNQEEYIKNDTIIDKVKIGFINCNFFENFELFNFYNKEKNLNYEITFENVVLEKAGVIMPLSSHNDGTSYRVSLNFNSIIFKRGLNVSSIVENQQKVIFTTNIFSTDSEGVLNFGNINFKRASLFGANSKLNISFEHCSFDEIDVKDFDNKATVKFTNSQVIEKLSIKNSELNDVIFRPLNARSLQIHPDSFLGGMKIYGSEPINLDNTHLSSENKQEFYRQLKQAAKNSNNKFLELEYKAREMAHYKPRSYDKITHWFNGLSDHGVNWLKPLIYIVYWNFVIWLILSYNLYTSYFVINLQKGYSLSEILLHLSFGLWIILNPVSRMSEFAAYLDYDQPVHSFVPFLFFSSKLLNGILIYQMISAFRKWVGKD